MSWTGHFHYLVVLLAFTLSLSSVALAALPTGYSLTEPIELSDSEETGACLFGNLSTIGACAVYCSSREWCVYFVFGPCDGNPPNPCRCMICYTKPSHSNDAGGRYVLGEIKTGSWPEPRRLLDLETSSGETLQSWSEVNDLCIQATGSIVATLSPFPINAFRVTTFGFSMVSTELMRTDYIEPVCAADFTSRGSASCTTGVWYIHSDLACYPTQCYQISDNSRYYAGTLAEIPGNRVCWPWNQQGSVENYYLGQVYHFDYYDIDLAKNYCRSFLLDLTYFEIWCYNGNYTGDPEPRYFVCEIPPCPELY